MNKKNNQLEQNKIIKTLEQKIRNKLEGKLVDNNKNKILRAYLFLMEHKSMGIPSLSEVSSYCGLSVNTCQKHMKNIIGDLQGDTFEANALRQLLMKKISDKALFEGCSKALRLAAECTGLLNPQTQNNNVMNQQVIYEVKGDDE
jgi:hypothetical protein